MDTDNRDDLGPEMYVQTDKGREDAALHADILDNDAADAKNRKWAVKYMRGIGMTKTQIDNLMEG